MQGEVAKCSSDVRSLMNDLRPTVLDHFGLYEALSEYLTSLVGSVPFAHRNPSRSAAAGLVAAGRMPCCFGWCRKRC